MRKRTGLRNKFRSGRSPYSIMDKRRRVDSYGSYAQGKRVGQESIAGRTLNYTFGENSRPVTVSAPPKSGTERRFERRAAVRAGRS